MSKYYKANDVDYAIRMKYAEEKNEEREEVISEICRLILDLPTIEVVHCKDCKCFLNPDYHPFEFCMDYTNVNCYCSYGIRKGADNESVDSN